MVLLSAGIGATPVLAMLHELSSTASHRGVWWLYGARNRDEHPFAMESRALIQSLPLGRSYICYSRPGVSDRLGEDYDAPGRLGISVLESLGVPRDADFYLCGPAEFLKSLTTALSAWGVSAHQVFTEIFGAGESMQPGIRQSSNAVTPSTRRNGGYWTPSFVYSKWIDGGVAFGLAQPAGTRGSVRRAGEVVVPNGSLPYLRKCVDRRCGRLPARAS